MSVVSLRADAGETMQDVSKSFRDTSKFVQPCAAREHACDQVREPRSNRRPVTSEEIRIQELVNAATYDERTGEFPWHNYKPSTLASYTKTDAVTDPTKRPVDHRLLQLLGRFLDTMNFATGGGGKLGTGNHSTPRGAIGAPENEPPAGCDAAGQRDVEPIHERQCDVLLDQNKNEPFNLFLKSNNNDDDHNNDDNNNDGNNNDDNNNDQNKGGYTGPARWEGGARSGRWPTLRAKPCRSS
ncbi:hypothetical protein MAPG_10664 [Magnaporthiopsis poae ATCC 64411]|uniref:Uncharacterized protein n=1 Tax=Magnaporthiopsis poae (strain ATCC 64411 / 73-15) TaxID=644358 RepID=A0A0C4ED71_MAGP6|nr:hypothetical protein MAPG_10664 [Magnaporthiopsis poae ATCC 64411]